MNTFFIVKRDRTNKRHLTECDYCCVDLSPAYIHLCRSLVITSIILGFFGSVLALVGMKCTKLGGSEILNARITFAAGMNYLLSGKYLPLSSIFQYVVVFACKLDLCLCCRSLWHACLQLVCPQGYFRVHGSELQSKKVNIAIQKGKKCEMHT